MASIKPTKLGEKSDATTVDELKVIPEVKDQNIKSYIVALSTELKMIIMDNLDEVSSACLGVTCKAFYGLHRKKHGAVRLSSGGKKYVEDGKMLANYLINWVPQELQYYNYKDPKFVSENQWDEMVVEWTKKERHEGYVEAYWQLPGLDEDEREEVADNYISDVVETGFKYQWRPHISQCMDEVHIETLERFGRACEILGVEPEEAVSMDYDVVQKAVDMA